MKRITDSGSGFHEGAFQASNDLNLFQSNRDPVLELEMPLLSEQIICLAVSHRTVLFNRKILI